MGLPLYPSVWCFCTLMRNLCHIFGYSDFLIVPMASDSSTSREMRFISLIHASRNMQVPSQLPQSFHRFIGKKVVCLRERNLPSTLMLNLRCFLTDILLSSAAAFPYGQCFPEYPRSCKNHFSLCMCKPHCTPGVKLLNHE